MDFKTLEETREKYFKKQRKVGFIVGAIFGGVVLIYILSWVLGGDFRFGLILTIPVLIFGFVFSVIIVSLMTRKEASDYREAYKTYFVETTMRKYFTDLNYEYARGLSSEILRETGMVTTGDRYYSNDFASGKYNEVLFSQADVNIAEEYTDSDGDTHTTTLFKGRWMIFEFPKKFSFRIAIRGAGGGGILSFTKRFGKNQRKFKEVKVESTEFNKMYKLYSEDGFETFYLLDPVFIKNLEDLGRKINGKILLLFVDNRLHIGINDYTDSFEPPKPSKPINEQIEFSKVERDIKIIVEFVKQLKLDNKLFK